MYLCLRGLGWQRRLRDLPSRVGVYFVLALGLFPRLGYALHTGYQFWRASTSWRKSCAVAPRVLTRWTRPREGSYKEGRRTRNR